MIFLAEKGEPQLIRRNDTEAAVVVSIAAWQRVNGKKESLVEFLQKSPSDKVISYLNRQDDLPREMSFE